MARGRIPGRITQLINCDLRDSDDRKCHRPCTLVFCSAVTDYGNWFKPIARIGEHGTHDDSLNPVDANNATDNILVSEITAHHSASHPCLLMIACCPFQMQRRVFIITTIELLREQSSLCLRIVATKQSSHRMQSDAILIH